MTQDKIDRINELARNSIKRNLSLQLESTVIVDEKGNKRKMQKKGSKRVKH